MNFQILFDIMKQTSHFRSSYFENIYMNAFCELIREGYPVFFDEDNCIVSDASYMYTASKKQLSSLIDLERYEKISNMLGLDKNEFIPDDSDEIDEIEEEYEEEIEELDENDSIEDDYDTVSENDDEEIEEELVDDDTLDEEEQVLNDAEELENNDELDANISEDDKTEETKSSEIKQENIIDDSSVLSENVEKIPDKKTESVIKDSVKITPPVQNATPAKTNATPAKTNETPAPAVDPLSILSRLYSDDETEKKEALKGLQEGVDYLGEPPKKEEVAESKPSVSKAIASNTGSAGTRTNTNPPAKAKNVNTPKDTNAGTAKKETANKADKKDASSEFPSFMNKKDFTFYYDHVIITTPSGEEEEAEFIVAPLSIQEGSKKIVVWVNTGDEIIVDMSRLRKTVLVHLETCDIIAGGEISNGEFVPFISLTKKEINDGFTMQEDKVFNNGHGGHIALVDDGIQVHIFPVTFNNNEKGDADYFYALYENDEYTTGDTSKAPATFIFNRVECKAVARWEEKEGTLYAAVMPK